MRKFFLMSLLVSSIIAAIASSSFAEDTYAKQINLGQDGSGMTWYLLDYGVKKDKPYAVARKYYTSNLVKEETIDILISRYSVSESKAAQLYFTEYKYEYTPDGKSYAETYRKYYDVRGNEIFKLVFSNKKGARKKHFVNVVKNTIQSKGAAYALGVLRK